MLRDLLGRWAWAIVVTLDLVLFLVSWVLLMLVWVLVLLWSLFSPVFSCVWVLLALSFLRLFGVVIGASVLVWSLV